MYCFICTNIDKHVSLKKQKYQKKQKTKKKRTVQQNEEQVWEGAATGPRVGERDGAALGPFVGESVGALVGEFEGAATLQERVLPCTR